MGGWVSGRVGDCVLCRFHTAQTHALHVDSPQLPPHLLLPADDEDDFFSSDEESAPTEADSRCGTLTAAFMLRLQASCDGSLPCHCFSMGPSPACSNHFRPQRPDPPPPPILYFLLPRSVASASVTGSQRFRIAIKPAEEAATTPRGDSVSLRNAVQVGAPALWGGGGKRGMMLLQFA